MTKKVLLRVSGTSEERNVVSKETDGVAGKLRDTINLVAGILKNSDTQTFICLDSKKELKLSIAFNTKRMSF